MAYTLDDYKAARDAFVGRLMMPKLAGDLSDSFRRRDDRIALEALEKQIPSGNRNGGNGFITCSCCGIGMQYTKHMRFCPFCGRAL